MTITYHTAEGCGSGTELSEPLTLTEGTAKTYINIVFNEALANGSTLSFNFDSSGCAVVDVGISDTSTQNLCKLVTCTKVGMIALHSITSVPEHTYTIPTPNPQIQVDFPIWKSSIGYSSESDCTGSSSKSLELTGLPAITNIEIDFGNAVLAAGTITVTFDPPGCTVGEVIIDAATTPTKICTLVTCNKVGVFKPTTLTFTGGEPFAMPSDAPKINVLVIIPSSSIGYYTDACDTSPLNDPLVLEGSPVIAFMKIDFGAELALGTIITATFDPPGCGVTQV
ncbi:MAG: hypothetical protein ACRC42_02530, partial [Mycoplasma sp.]